jgi:replicative superfamily II helicase
VNESTGDAYTYSGRTLDSMKKYKRNLAIKTNDVSICRELETEFKLLEVILSGWTINSAEVIYWTLLELNENEISEKLKVTQSAVNQRKKTAGWIGIEPLLERFTELMEGEMIG